MFFCFYPHLNDVFSLEFKFKLEFSFIYIRCFYDFQFYYYYYLDWYYCYFYYYYLILNQQLDNHEIKPGKSLKINISVPNLRLFVGNIPKSKGKEEILDEFGKLTGN